MLRKPLAAVKAGNQGVRFRAIYTVIVLLSGHYSVRVQITDISEKQKPSLAVMAMEILSLCNTAGLMKEKI